MLQALSVALGQMRDHSWQRTAATITYFADKASTNPTGKKHGILRPQKLSRLIRDGEVVRGQKFLYLTPTRYAVTTRMIVH